MRDAKTSTWSRCAYCSDPGQMLVDGTKQEKEEAVRESCQHYWLSVFDSHLKV